MQHLLNLQRGSYSHPLRRCGTASGWNRARGEVRLVILAGIELQGRERDLIGGSAAFGLHLLDFAAYAGDLALDIEHVGELASALQEQLRETLLGVAGVGEARDEIGVSAGHVFAFLRFVFDAAELPEVGKRGIQFGGGNA